VQHRGQPVVALVRGWHPKLHARVADASLRPADALPDRRLRHEQSACDLCRGEAAERAQRQRNLRRHGQLGVTAQEHQRQRVVDL
jgi:hypothetical protein